MICSSLSSHSVAKIPAKMNGVIKSDYNGLFKIKAEAGLGLKRRKSH